MKNNKLAILLVLLLAAAAVWFVLNNGSGTINNALRNFSVNDTASINKIILTGKDLAINLEKQPDGTWKVNSKYFADMHAVRKLIYAINKVDIKTPVSKNETASVLKKLVESGVKCKIYTNGELEKAYYVGGYTPDKTGTYMVLMDVETEEPYTKPFITNVPGYNSYLTTYFSTDLKKWSDKTVFNYNETDIKSVRIENHVKPENNYELRIDNHQYRLKMLKDEHELANLDTSTVNQYLTYFYKLNFDSVDTSQTNLQDSNVLVNTVTVTDHKGIRNKVVFYAPKHSNENPNQLAPMHFYAKLENGNVVSVQLYLFGKIMPEPTYFLKD